MNKQFRQHIESLHPSFEVLISSEPFQFASLPKVLPKAGVYLFSEGEHHLYVGRTNNIRKRLQQHCRQALLEMYVAVALAAPYNDFDNH